MNIEELSTNKDVVNYIAESLEDIPQDSTAKYDLWVIGLNKNAESIAELFIYEFDSLADAIAKAETINPKFIEEQVESPITKYCDNFNIECFFVEIETIVENPDTEDDGAICINTPYRRVIII